MPPLCIPIITCSTIETTVEPPRVPASKYLKIHMPKNWKVQNCSFKLFSIYSVINLEVKVGKAGIRIIKNYFSSSSTHLFNSSPSVSIEVSFNPLYLVPGWLKHSSKFPSCLCHPHLCHGSLSGKKKKHFIRLLFYLKLFIGFLLNMHITVQVPSVSLKISHFWTMTFLSRFTSPIPLPLKTYNLIILNYVQFPKHVILLYFSIMWLQNFVFKNHLRSHAQYKLLCPIPKGFDLVGLSWHSKMYIIYKKQWLYMIRTYSCIILWGTLPWCLSIRFFVLFSLQGIFFLLTNYIATWIFLA